MDDGIAFPVFFQFHDLQSFEEFLLAPEVGSEGGTEQTLTEPAGTAEEDELAAVCQLPNEFRLVHIDVFILGHLRKGLNSNGVIHVVVVFSDKDNSFSIAGDVLKCFSPAKIIEYFYVFYEIN